MPDHKVHHQQHNHHRKEKSDAAAGPPASLDPLRSDRRSALDPHSKFVESWHVVLFCCLLYEAFLLPFAVTFMPASRETLTRSTAFQLFYAIEALFCFDFYVQLNTGYYQDGNVHRDARTARIKYILTPGFVLDAVAIVPLSLLPIDLPASAHLGWLEVHKVLRVWRLPKYYLNLEDVFSKNFVVMKLLKVLVLTAFIVHCVACARYAFGYAAADESNASTSWLPRASLAQTSMSSKYVRTLFWSLGLITGVFEGELPTRNREFVFTIAVAMLGFALFTYLCAVLFMLSKSESSQSTVAEARISQLKHLLSFHHVPDVLQAQVVEFIKRHYTDAESNDREVVKLLCPSISKDIQVELLKSMMAKIPIFHGCNDQFIIALTSLLEMISLPAHYTLFSVGDAGDCMYVVNSGVLHILVNGVKVRELRQGSFFGEVSIFSKRPRSATVVTTSYCTLYRLSRFHTERVLEGYPHYAVLISNTVDEIVNQHQNVSAATGDGELPTEHESMLTTLYQLSTALPTTDRQRFKKNRSLTNQLPFRSKRPMLGRSKSSQNVSAARHAGFNMKGGTSVTEKVELNTSPIVLPKIAPRKRPQLTRSKSAFPRQLSSGTAFLARRARAASDASSSGPQDAIKGFYDNLSSRLLQQERDGHATAGLWSKLLMKSPIDSTSRVRQYWLLAIQLHLLFNWVFIPLLLSFPLMNCSIALLAVLHVLADLVLLLDMYLSCHLTFMGADHEMVMHPVAISLHYFHGAFVADLLCLLPYEVLLLGVNMSNPALLRLPRLLRVWRVRGHLREWEMSFRLYSRGKLAIVAVAFLVFAHLVTCLHFGLTRIEGFSSETHGWMPFIDLDMRQVTLGSGDVVYQDIRNTTYNASALHRILGMQYTWSLFVATTMLTTRGKISEPSSNLQYGVALVILLCGMVWTAFFIDTVQKRFTASALEQKEFLVTRTRIQKFLSCQNAPLEVHHRVSAFLDFWWSSHRGAIVSELLSELPETIKRQVLRSMCKPALQTLSLMHGVRSVLDGLEQVFVDNVRFILYGQGETIYRQGDYASGLFFLLEGEVVIISNGGAPRTIPRGGFIGTASLHLNERSVSYAERLTAISGCILLFISREHLDAMHKPFPTLSMALKSLEKRLVHDPKLAKAQEFTPTAATDHSASGTQTLQCVSLETRVLSYLGIEEVVFDPDAMTTSAWEVIVFVLMSAQSFKVIYDICFGVWQERAVASDATLVLLELFLSFDLFVQSRLGYYQYGNKVMELKLIKKRRVRSRQFALELAAIVPLFAVNWILPSVTMARKELLNVNKLLRLFRVPRVFARLENQFLNRTLELRIAKLVFVSFLLSHLFGCMWFTFANETGNGAAVVGSSGGVDSSVSKWGAAASLGAESRWFQYSAAIFWSFGLMSASYAIEPPRTSAQCVFTVVVLFCGFFLFAFIVGNLSDVVELVDADTREFNAKMSSLRHLLAHFQLPQALQDKLKTYFFFQRFHTITQEHILERCLPPSLLTDIRLVHLQPMIMKVAFLSGMEGSVTRMLVSQFSQVLVVKNQYVCRYGEPGSDMFFVFTGILDVLVPIETLRRRLSNERTPEMMPVAAAVVTPRAPVETDIAAETAATTTFHTYFSTADPTKSHAVSQMKKVNELSSGSYFGEVAMFTDKPRSAHTRSRTSCVLYKLSRPSLELVFERYPDWKTKVFKIVSIQQEQQHLRNLYMEEQQDVSATAIAADKSLGAINLLDAAQTSAVSNRPQTFTDRLATGSRCMLSGMASQVSSVSSAAGANPLRRVISSSVSSQSLSAASTSLSELQFKRQESPLWVDSLLQCTEAQSAFHIAWLKAVAVGTVFMAVVVPYRISFDLLERFGAFPVVLRALELACEVLFAWDICLNWNMREGSASMELYEQHHRQSYKNERLWCDVLAAFPIDHFLSDFCTSPWFRINRCLKLANFPHYIKEINRRSVSYERNRVGTLWTLYFVLMHWCACTYFSVSTLSARPRDSQAANDASAWSGWSIPAAYQVAPSETASPEWLLLRFLRGFAFSTTAFAKRGKTFTPVAEVDYIFSTLVSFTGLLFMAFLIGESANLYTSYISNVVEFRKRHIEITTYLERWQVSGQLKRRAHAFLSSLWSAHRGVNYQALFDEIPLLIRTESIEFIAGVPLDKFLARVFRPFTTTHPHDRELELLLHAISQHLKYEGYPRDECVLVEGSVTKAMYFVVKGHLVSRSVAHFISGLQSAEMWIGRGDFFGEQGLLGYAVSKCTVKTISACDLLSLSSEVLLQVILSRPLFQSALGIAVEAYREMRKRVRGGKIQATTEGEWGELLFAILNARKAMWQSEALAAADEESGVTAARTASSDELSWRTSGVQAGRELGLMAIHKPSESVRVFDHMLQLIVAHGARFDRAESLHSTTSHFQENLPLMAAVSFGMFDDPKATSVQMAKTTGVDRGDHHTTNRGSSSAAGSGDTLGVTSGGGGADTSETTAGAPPLAYSITEASDCRSKAKANMAMM